MTIGDVRTKYLDYFQKKNHAVIAPASLLPENDPTTLFTGSGMQPLLPYLLGEDHPSGTRLTNSQRCFRSGDIEEVGDNRHTTFFEMLGNWSLGDYFKEEQLRWCFEFLTDEIGLNPERLYVTAFMGDEGNGIPRDTESVALWQKLFKEKGIEATAIEMGSEEEGAQRGMQGGRIFYYDASKNWWSRAGSPEAMPAGEPGGPDSEVFFDFGTPHDPAYGAHCHPNCDCGRFMEIGNSVFMEYLKQPDGSFAALPKKNVDFGGGLERIAAAAADNPDVFSIDAFKNTISYLEAVSGAAYEDPETIRSFRIIADHIRAAVFTIADGAVPANAEAGYFTRRLIRRSVRALDALGGTDSLAPAAESIIDTYGDAYPHLSEKRDTILSEICGEEDRFRKTLTTGLRKFEELSGDTISGKEAFLLFSTYGFPIEMTEEMARERGKTVDREGFQKEMEQHQETSRAGAEQKFKGGLADSSERTTQLHSATHLMLAGLRKYLGEDVHQAGSNITAERTRFDFTYPEKVEREMLDTVEQYVNDAIAAGAERVIEEMPKEEAKAIGVEGSFWERYPDIVQVYTFKSPDGTVWSRELCGGPHVENTAEIEGTFKITKEESVAAGVRRVKATLS